MVQQMEIHNQGRKLIVSVLRSGPNNRDNLLTGRRSEHFLFLVTDA